MRFFFLRGTSFERQPLVGLLGFFIAGITVGYNSGLVPDYRALGGCCAVFCGVALFEARKLHLRIDPRSKRLAGLSLAAACFVLGWMSYAIRVEQLETGVARFNGKQVEIWSVVVAPPEVSNDRTYLVLEPEAVRDTGDPEGLIETRNLTGLVRLTLANTGTPPDMDQFGGRGASRARQPRYGDRVYVRTRLKTPSRALNPGEFCYRSYLARKGIVSTAYVEKPNDVLVLESGGGNPIMRLSDRFRSGLEEGIRGAVPGGDSDLVLAITLGLDKSLSPEIEQAFREAGISHLTAVSGLHVGFVAAGLYWLLKLLSAGPVVRCLATTAGIVTYVLAVGSPPSAIRAGVVAIIVVLASAFGRRRRWESALACAAWLILLENPLLLFDAGFQLSFSAAASIGLLSRTLSSKIRAFVPEVPKPAVKAFSVSLAAQIGVAPLLAYYFNGFSLWSPVTSLIATPFAALCLESGLAAGVLWNISAPAGTALGSIAALAANLIEKTSLAFSSLPVGWVQLPSPHSAALICYYISLVLIRRRLSEPQPFANYRAARDARIVRMAVIAVSCLVIWIPVAADWRENDLVLYFLGVGPGDAILIETPEGDFVLVDGGGRPSYPDGSFFDVGERIVIPALRNLRVDRLDTVVLTHSHTDHSQGLVSAVREFGTKRVLVASPFEDPWADPAFAALFEVLDSSSVLVYNVRAGDVLDLGGGATAEILHPDSFWFEDMGEGAGPNDSSIVMAVRYAGDQVLLTGDIERSAIDRLLSRYPGSGQLSSTVLKFPHHGSQTSLSDEFLDEVDPDAVIIQGGRMSVPGGPSLKVMNWLESYADLEVFWTERDGCVRVTLSGRGRGVSIETYRGAERWFKAAGTDVPDTPPAGKSSSVFGVWR